MKGGRPRRQWSILTTGGDLRWGGDIRRHYIFRALGAMARARVVTGFSMETLRAQFPPIDERVVGEIRTIASTELLGANALGVLTGRGELAVVDVHDHPLLQLETFGIPVDQQRRDELLTLFQRNISGFQLLVSQSQTFATLAGLASDRTLLAPNGTDTVLMPAAPMPSGHIVGMASGAAPGRGIEELIEAAQLLRSGRGDLELLLWLVATGAESERYLEALGSRTKSLDWVRIETVPYESIGLAMSHAAVLCVPNPPSSYWDAVLPIKLADSMGAGRPVVVTPRTEMAAMVERAGAGVVAAGDSSEDLAAAIDRVFSHPSKARKMARSGRRFAQRELDWRVIGKRLAKEVIRRIE